MQIAGIVRDSIVDGIGVRDVIFVQGCGRHCKGCHNSQTWDYLGGKHMFTTEIMKELSNSSNDITISGGEPLDQIDRLLVLLSTIKRETNKKVWLYTGNTVDITKNTYQLLGLYVECIVDGAYVEELRDPNLRFRGSSNQRIIDIKKSLKANSIVLWEECE